MIAPGEAVFVDTGAWIALAIVRDALHRRALEAWNTLVRARARVMTSVPVVIETFTYLDRKGSRELAATWSASLAAVERFEVLDCTSKDLRAAWKWLDRRDLHKLSLVDATSFALMHRNKIRVAFAFDTHFAIAGMRCLG